jgi:riboflavin synthase
VFTGLIEEVGFVVSTEIGENGGFIRVRARSVMSDLKEGDSIAVNGVCLTAVKLLPDSFGADVSPETIQRTTINDLRAGSPVNLERAATPTTRLGGHIVQGHVDGRGTFLSAEEPGDSLIVKIGFPPELAKYFVEKGSVAIDGISLTIAALHEDHFDIAVIPKTSQATNIATHLPGVAVNIEVDVIAKYVERLLAGTS